MKNRKKGLIILSIIILLAVITSLLAGKSTREAIISPILYTAWTISLLINRSPQMIFWIIFISVSILVAARSLNTEKQQQARSSGITLQRPGRVTTLTRWLREASHGAYFRQRLARHLLKLTLKANGYREQPDAFQTADILKRNELQLNSEALAYLKNSTLLVLEDLGSMTSGSSRLVLALKRLLIPGREKAYTEPGLDALINHLEKELEIQYDNQDQ